MRKLGPWLLAMLTAHPRWASQLTPAKTVVAIMFCCAILVMPPPNAYWAGAALLILVTSSTYVVLVTAQDIYIHLMATVRANDDEQLVSAMHGGNFSTWLYWNGGEHLMYAFKYDKDVTELTPDVRYELAAQFERYTLSDPRERNPFLPVLSGALMFFGVVGAWVCYKIMPKTTQRLFEGIDRWLAKPRDSDDPD
jgi:hypothetical protein